VLSNHLHYKNFLIRHTTSAQCISVQKQPIFVMHHNDPYRMRKRSELKFASCTNIQNGLDMLLHDVTCSLGYLVSTKSGTGQARGLKGSSERWIYSSMAVYVWWPGSVKCDLHFTFN